MSTGLVIRVSLGMLLTVTIGSSPSTAAPFPEARQAFEAMTIQQRVMAQILLNATGYSPVVPMERLNRTTYEAIKSFEADNGFPASGVLDDPQVDRLVSSAKPYMRLWGFQKVNYPGSPINIWAPVGLGMAVHENNSGLHFRDAQGRLSLDMVSVIGVNLRNAHADQLVDGEKHSATVHYDSYRNGDDWFAISSTWADGSDHYYRYHQDNARVTGFALEWNNEVENINAERIATIMSGSLRSAMTGAPFIDPPVIEAEPAPQAAATPQASMPEAATGTSTGAAAAAPTADPANCAAVREAAARLACFDTASGAHHDASDTSSPDGGPAPLSPPSENRSVAVSNVAPAALHVDDILVMKGTYSDNQARFFRDFKNRHFSAVMPMDSVTENLLSKGTFVIQLGGDQQVACEVTDQAALKFITDLTKGDQIKVDGVVDDELFGVVRLRDCDLKHG